MTTEENKALMQRFYEEVINQGNLDLLEDFLIEDFVDNNPITMEQAAGIEGVREAISYLRTAFPDIRFEIKDMIAEDDKLAYVVSITGTHKGEFWGVEPTDKKIDTIIIDYMRFENGKIAERWGLFDVYNLMKQLGQYEAA